MTSNKAIPCEIYTRCVGYFRPVSQFNAGKKSEFADRKPYAVPDFSRMMEDKNVSIPRNS